MAFDNVEMGPVEEAFLAWSDAKEASVHAAEAVSEMERYYDRSASPNGPRFRVDVEPGALVTFSQTPRWRAIGDFLARTLEEDSFSTVCSAAAALKAEAEEARVRFLRLTMDSVAGAGGDS